MKAQHLLIDAADRGIGLDNLVQESPTGLIVVPEKSMPSTVCRYEFILGHSQSASEFVQHRIAPFVEQLVQHELVVFKDKCNEKNAGGGAFRPHQDFPVYRTFGPRWHVTAMLAIEPTTIQNGCLQVATNLNNGLSKSPSAVECWIGGRPVLNQESGNERNGDILEVFSRELTWQSVIMMPGDVFGFDSFVAHRSGPNRTSNSRPAWFLIFNKSNEGLWYSAYYSDKRANYGDPKIHVGTPTAFS